MSMAPTDLNWVDAAVLAILGVSALVGVLRGLVFEVLSLFGWIVAWWCAQAWGVQVAAALHIGSDGSPMQRGAGFLVCFVGSLLGWKVLSWLVQQLVKATPLAPMDRLLGAAFGVLRGGVIVLVAVMGLGLTPLVSSEAWRSASSVRWAQAVIVALAPILPGRWPLARGDSGRTGF
jgi:membrane protein required for colicin V production